MKAASPGHQQRWRVGRYAVAAVAGWTALAGVSLAWNLSAYWDDVLPGAREQAGVLIAGHVLLWIAALAGIVIVAVIDTRRLRERDQAQHVLRASEERLQVILNAIQLGIVIIDAETHVVIDANPAALKLIGGRREDVVGHSCHKYICPAEDGNCPITDCGQKIDNVERVIRTVDGSSVPILQTVVSITLQGRERLIESIVDISELKRAEARVTRDASVRASLSDMLALSQHAKSPEELFQGALDLLTSLDYLPVQDRGAGFLVADEPGQLVLKASRNLTDPQKELCACVPFGRCLCGRAAAEGEIQWASCIDERHESCLANCESHGHYNVPVKIDSDVAGVLSLYLEAGAVYRDEDVAFLAAASDTIAGALRRLSAEESQRQSNTMMIDALTNEKRAAVKLEMMMEQLETAKREAEVANQSKSAFLANMSHEIRTPMTAILGFAENVSETVREPEIVDAISTIRRNGEYLLGLINDILDLSKIEADKVVVERIACNPCEIIAETASLMRVHAEAKGITIEFEYVSDIPEIILTDPTRVRQTLINLIGNSIKFTEQGKVRLITQLVTDGDEPLMQFDVADTGIGMTSEQAAKLFQPFTQADVSTTRKFGGTGLGLTISRQLARLLGGELTLVETASGIGTRMRVTVAAGSLAGVKMLEDPLAATTLKPEAASAETARRDDRTTLEGARILLAEDGPDNQRLIAFILKKVGADVTIVENGELAVEAAQAALAEERPYGVILMDMQMPVMDGYDASIMLRAQGYTRPIIALTAHAMESARQECLDAGCDDYASKPIDRKLLIEMIREHLLAPAGG